MQQSYIMKLENYIVVPIGTQSMYIHQGFGIEKRESFFIFRLIYELDVNFFFFFYFINTIKIHKRS